METGRYSSKDAPLTGLPQPARSRTRPHGKAHAVVVLSGGQDSTTCLYWAKAAGFDEVHAVTFDYGQKHSIELQAARTIARLAGVASHEVINVEGVLQGASPLINPLTDLETYGTPSDLPQTGIQSTFVAMRNQLFLTIAANRAYVLEAEALITGVSQADYGGYPDCRDGFIKAMAHACNLGTFTGEAGAPASLAILTPLMHLSKADAVELALELPGCYEALAFSHTAYDGAYPPTGHDHASLLRQKGFEGANIPDPLVLRAYLEGLMELPDLPIYHATETSHYVSRIYNALANQEQT